MSLTTIKTIPALLAFCCAALWDKPAEMHKYCSGRGILSKDDNGNVVRGTCTCRCHQEPTANHSANCHVGHHERCPGLAQNMNPCQCRCHQAQTKASKQ